MVNTFIDVVVKQPDGDVIINGITNLNYMVSVKNLVSKLYIQVPLTKIEYNATSASSVNYGDITISIGDYVICQMGYTDIQNIPSKYFDGYITTFVLTKTELTFEIESYSWLLKKLPRVKFSLNKASVKDIILEATKGYSTDKKEYIEVKYGAYNPFKIYFEDLTFEGNFILKDPLSPFEVITMIADELEIYCYTSPGEEENKPGIYISKRSFADTKYYAYPYIKYKEGGINYNFIIDIDIDQQNINLQDYIVKANSTKSTIEKLKVAYAISGTTSGLDAPTFVDYTTERPTTIQIEYPSVDEATLKKLVVYAWDKLEAEKEKQGSFTTFIEQGVNLTDRIHINLYGTADNHAVDGVETTFDTNSGLRQKVTLGKKLSKFIE